jgi:hypothetical protein
MGTKKVPVMTPQSDWYSIGETEAPKENWTGTSWASLLNRPGVETVRQKALQKCSVERKA